MAGSLGQWVQFMTPQAKEAPNLLGETTLPYSSLPQVAI